MLPWTLLHGGVKSNTPIAENVIENDLATSTLGQISGSLDSLCAGHAPVLSAVIILSPTVP